MLLGPPTGGPRLLRQALVGPAEDRDFVKDWDPSDEDAYFFEGGVSFKDRRTLSARAPTSSRGPAEDCDLFKVWDPFGEGAYFFEDCDCDFFEDGDPLGEGAYCERDSHEKRGYPEDHDHHGNNVDTHCWFGHGGNGGADNSHWFELGLPRHRGFYDEGGFHDFWGGCYGVWGIFSDGRRPGHARRGDPRLRLSHGTNSEVLPTFTSRKRRWWWRAPQIGASGTVFGGMTTTTRPARNSKRSNRDFLL